MKINVRFINLFFCICFLTGVAAAQNTAFTYQGKLTDNSAAANGAYKMQFALFDAANNQIGSTINIPNVAVSSGVFTVSLDFGAAAFSGADRFLQVSVFSNQTNQYADLTPRQLIASAPYALRSQTASLADKETADAFKTVQSQNDELQKRLLRQELLIDALRKIVCAQNSTADVCKAEK